MFLASTRDSGTLPVDLVEIDEYRVTILDDEGWRWFQSTGLQKVPQLFRHYAHKSVKFAAVFSNNQHDYVYCKYIYRIFFV